jgi:signal peptidase
MTNNAIAQDTAAGREGIRWPRVAGWLAVAAVVVAIVAAVVLPKILGYQTFVVYGSSMEPAIPVGALTFAAPVATEDLEVGDIIVFQSPGNGVRLTHRIIEIREEGGSRLFRTKGDASPGDDPLEVDLGGRTQKVDYHVSYLGYVVNFAKSPLGILLFIILPAAAFFALTFLGDGRARNKEAIGEA